MAERDPAMARFWTLQIVRLAGMGLALGGAMILSGRIDQPEPLGLIAVIVGLVTFLLIPRTLARRWKSTP